MDQAITAKDVEKNISLSRDEYWRLRVAFQRYAQVQGLDINRSHHPNYYDSDETEEHWTTWLSLYAYMQPVIRQLIANQKVIE